MRRYGVDVGGTKVQAERFPSLSAVNGIVRSDEMPTTGNFHQDMVLVGRLLRQLDPEITAETSIQVGIAVPGRLNAFRTTILSAGNLTGWVDDGSPGLDRDIPRAIRRQLRRRPHGTKITVGNDGEAQALAEALHNPALHGEDFVLWAPGTGIATARVVWINGHPYSLPMEAQHARVCIHDGRTENPNPCGCNVPCTEAYGSGRAAEELYGIWWRPDTLSDQQVRELAHAQAWGLANVLTNHLVGTVVLGGGVAVRDPRLIVNLQEELDKLTISGMGAKIVPSLYGPSAGTLGALALLQLAA